MHTMRQQLRQPLKTLSGILLVALAVAVLCVSVSQTLAAEETARKLNETYLTVALPANSNVEGKNEWLDQMIQAHPEIFTSDIRHVLASGYAPNLEYDNHTQHYNLNDDVHDYSIVNRQPKHLSYAGAMFEITLVGFSDPRPLDKSEFAPEEDSGIPLPPTMDGAVTVPPGTPCVVSINGTIERVIGLQGGYSDPTNFTLRADLIFPDVEAWEATGVNRGDRCLIYGQSYEDLDWLLRDEISESMAWWRDKPIPEWDINTLTYDSRFGLPQCKIGDLYHRLSQKQVESFQVATLHHHNMADVDPDSVYAIPTIARLTGTAEEFLSSSEGARWQKALEDLRVNTHAFPVIGTDNMKYIAEFSLGSASISEGRAFDEQEAADGAKVCLISTDLAKLNNIQVGDKIDLRLYDQDLNNPAQQYIHDGEGIVNPTAYLYNSSTVSLSEAPEYYTVVGIYKQDSPWGNIADDLYAFSPNTIFVPKKSVHTVTDTSLEGQFRTMIIASDRLDELQEMAIQDGMDATLEYFDNGYHSVASTLVNFEAAAKRILPLGLIIYGVIMALFLFLYPSREGRTLTRMDSLGASGILRVGHVCSTTLTILLPGSILGTGAAILLWKRVSNEIQKWMGTSITILLDARQLWIIMGLQILAVMLLTLILGGILSVRINYMKKR